LIDPPVDEADEIEPEIEDDGGHTLQIVIAADQAGERLDKTLAGHLPDMSRARLQTLLGRGALTFAGVAQTSPSAKAQAGVYSLRVPAPAAALPLPEEIPLTILFEDEHLIVIDKPAGMAAHPAPGSHAGTVVNALLHHCAGTLAGVGGVARPGIVHRLDKDTSGVMVVAKSDAAHAGLSALFAKHDIERRYIALVRGEPNPTSATITTQIGRSAHDRKKMAVLRAGGREAVTRYRVQRVFGAPERPVASRVACELETGRTHQIRVHLSSKGCPCLGDPVYGSGPPAGIVRDAIVQAGLTRQALHAAVLGFVHPITQETLRFETPLPADMAALEGLLAAL
jgi:23S rRNA pseudouridine1911/1915/1917 synthase